MKLNGEEQWLGNNSFLLQCSGHYSLGCRWFIDVFPSTNDSLAAFVSSMLVKDGKSVTHQTEQQRKRNAISPVQWLINAFNSRTVRKIHEIPRVPVYRVWFSWRVLNTGVGEFLFVELVDFNGRCTRLFPRRSAEVKWILFYYVDLVTLRRHSSRW